MHEPSKREPNLLTHDTDEPYYGYTEDDWDGYDDGYDDWDSYEDAEASHAEGSNDPDGEGSGHKAKAALTPKQRKRRRWRRIRRTLYALFGIFFVLPALAFTITYFIVDVPTPQEVAAKQNKVITYYYANGEEMGKEIPSGGGNRVILESDQIPEVVKHAVYAAEDATFETNPGFDIGGIAYAAWSQLTGGGGGGSTISQQYVKLATDNDAPTVTRKFTEVVKSFKMNNEQSKTEIITAYLNTIYLGRGAYGIQTAAQAYFGKDVAELNASEAAQLAGMIQNPGRSEDLEYAKQRWTYVLDQMVANRWLSPQDRAAAKFPKRIPLEDSRPQSINGPSAYIQNRVKAELAAKGYPEEKLQSGGYKVYTTIDPRAQDLAKQAVEKVMKGEPEKLREALVAVDPKTGGVKAYYGGPNNEQDRRDWANTTRNPGSAFKPFDLVALLKTGHGLGETYNGTSPRVIGGQKIFNAGPGSSCSTTCTVAKAMEVSANTVFVDMVVNDVGVQAVKDAAHAAGIPMEQTGTTSNISIGGQDTQVTPTAMAGAYATFASGGVRHDTHFVSKLTTVDDELVFETNTEGKPAFAPDDPELNKKIAGNVTMGLEPVLGHSSLRCGSGYDCAGKTGTHEYVAEGGGKTSENAQAWMAGYSPTIAAAAWVGTGSNQPIRDANGAPIYGADLPGSIWQTFMRSYLEGTPKEHFPKVERIGKPPARQYQPPATRNRNTETRETETQDNEPTESSETSETSTPEQPTSSTENGSTTFPPPGNGGGDDDGGIFGQRRPDDR